MRKTLCILLALSLGWGSVGLFVATRKPVPLVAPSVWYTLKIDQATVEFNGEVVSEIALRELLKHNYFVHRLPSVKVDLVPGISFTRVEEALRPLVDYQVASYELGIVGDERPSASMEAMVLISDYAAMPETSLALDNRVVQTGEGRVPLEDLGAYLAKIKGEAHDVMCFLEVSPETTAENLVEALRIIESFSGVARWNPPHSSGPSFDKEQIEALMAPTLGEYAFWSLGVAIALGLLIWSCFVRRKKVSWRGLSNRRDTKEELAQTLGIA